jgi:CRP-like cAMP-binding protein
VPSEENSPASNTSFLKKQPTGYLCHMHEPLLKLVATNITLSPADKDLCIRYFEPVHFAKGRTIEEEGKIPRYLYFIVSGYVRLFHYNDKGDEVTTHINCPPMFITSYSHFINQTRSGESLECITACELLRISKPHLDLVVDQSAAFKNFSISVYQQSITYNENRSKELASLIAEQRYEQLVENYPQILQRVPLQYIASFLGMNPKSLSRIRKQIMK